MTEKHKKAIQALSRCYSVQDLYRSDEILAALASITKQRCFRAARNIVLEAIEVCQIEDVQEDKRWPQHESK